MRVDCACCSPVNVGHNRFSDVDTWHLFPPGSTWPHPRLLKSIGSRLQLQDGREGGALISFMALCGKNGGTETPAEARLDRLLLPGGCCEALWQLTDDQKKPNDLITMVLPFLIVYINRMICVCASIAITFNGKFCILEPSKNWSLGPNTPVFIL